MKRRDLERHLLQYGARPVGEGKSHSKWRGPNGQPSVVPRHNEIAPGTARAICIQLGVPAPRLR